MLITVVVLNWNGEALLPACLDALAKQDLQPDLWQTWVVDNGSTDASLELLRRDYPDVTVIENGANLGFTGGNNVALRSVGTPFVALLNNDAFPEEDWLGQLLAEIQAPEAERVAAISSKVLFEPRFLCLDFNTPQFAAPSDPRELGAQIDHVSIDGSDVTGEVLWDHGAYGVEHVGDRRYRWTRPSGHLLVPCAGPEAGVRITLAARSERDQPFTFQWEGGEQTVELTTRTADHQFTIPPGTPPHDVINNVGSILLEGGYGADRGYQEVDTGQFNSAEDVFLMCCAAVCLRTEALREVGVLDDDFFMYYEDTDLSWRLQAAGWRIRYSPMPVVRHLHSASSGEWSPFFTFHVERNRLLLLAKNAPAGLAIRQTVRYVVTTGSMLRRSLIQAVRQRRTPSMKLEWLRIRAFLSYLRLLPKMLARRHAYPPVFSTRGMP